MWPVSFSLTVSPSCACSVVKASLAALFATITKRSSAPLGNLSISITPEVILPASIPLATPISIICPFSSLVIEFIIVPDVALPPTGV